MSNLESVLKTASVELGLRGLRNFATLIFAASVAAAELEKQIRRARFDAAKLRIAEKRIKELESETRRSSAIVDAASSLIASKWLTGYHELRFSGQKWDALEAAVRDTAPTETPGS